MELDSKINIYNLIKGNEKFIISLFKLANYKDEFIEYANMINNKNYNFTYQDFYSFSMSLFRFVFNEKFIKSMKMFGFNFDPSLFLDELFTNLNEGFNKRVVLNRLNEIKFRIKVKKEKANTKYREKYYLK